MAYELQGKSVLITGANHGLGLGFVRQLLDLSSPPKYIFASCRKSEETEELRNLSISNPSVHVLKLDLEDEASIVTCAELVQSMVGSDGLNILINNAGVQLEEFTDRLADLTVEKMTRTLNINCVGTTMVTKNFLPLIERASKQITDGKFNPTQAAIFTMTAIWGSVSKMEHRLGCHWNSFSVSKAALNMMMRLICQELNSNDEKILCALLYPGWVKTDFGGPDGDITPDEAAKNLLDYMASTNETNHDAFFTYDGQEFPF